MQIVTTLNITLIFSYQQCDDAMLLMWLGGMQSSTEITSCVRICGSCELVVLPPQHVEELLYNLDRCSCDLEWCCVPHNACFIHDSCFCEGSGSFPPVKPQRPSWAQFLYDW